MENWERECTLCKTKRVMAYFPGAEDSKSVGELLCPKCNPERIKEALSILEDFTLTQIQEIA